MSAEHPVVYRIQNMEWIQSGFVTRVTWKAYKYVNDVQGEVGGMMDFPQEEGTEGFTPFNQLTEQLVISWVQSKLNPQNIEEALDKDIASKAIAGGGGLPWSRFRTQ